MSSGVVVEGVVFEGIDDVERVEGFEVLAILCHAEGNTIHYVFGRFVGEFEFEVLVVATDDFAGSVVVEHAVGVEDWLWIARPKWFELTQDADELRRDVGELESCVNLDLRCELMLLDIVGYIFLETTDELFEILFFE